MIKTGRVPWRSPTVWPFGILRWSGFVGHSVIGGLKQDGRKCSINESERWVNSGSNVCNVFCSYCYCAYACLYVAVFLRVGGYWRKNC